MKTEALERKIEEIVKLYTKINVKSSQKGPDQNARIYIKDVHVKIKMVNY